MITMKINSILRKTSHADKEKIIPFLERNYYRHEPLQLMYLAKHVERMSPADRQETASYLYKRHELLLSCCVCFTLHHRETDEIIAAMLIHVEESPWYKKENPAVCISWRPEDDQRAIAYETFKQLTSNSPMVKDVFRTIMFAAMQKIRIFDKFMGIGKAGNIMLMCVAEKYRGTGVAKIFIGKAVAWAKKNGISVLYGLFTSEFAEKAAERNNFKRIMKNMDLMKFKNELEKPIFEGMEPRHISVMAIEM